MARKQYGYWRSEENVLVEARKVMQENDLITLPPQRELRKLGYEGLVNAISKHHGGYYKFRKTLGENQRRLESGTWKDLDFTLKQARKVMEEHGLENLPSVAKLRKMGYSGLVSAVHRYHGRFSEFRELLGKEPLRLKKGTWVDLDYTIEQARKVMEEYGFKIIPSQKTLRELGYSSLASAISKHHGGYHAFRKLFGEDLRRKVGVWKDLDFAIEQAREIIENHNLTTLPCLHKLIEMGYSSLSSAIGKYHGGFKRFRGILNKRTGRKSGREQLEQLLGEYVT